MLCDMDWRAVHRTCPSVQDKTDRGRVLIVNENHDNRSIGKHKRSAIMSEQVNDLGPLEPILADAAVTEIMVNGPHTIYIERHGKLEKVEQAFRDEAHVMAVIHYIFVTQLGQKVDESNPIVDGRLADGSRIHVVVRPIAIDGPYIVIRKFIKAQITLENLVEYGSLSPEMAEFIRVCVQSGINIFIAGGTGSGKTTVLNTLANCINPEERILLLENVSELRLVQPHVVVMETRPPNIEGRGEVTMQQLIQSAVKMRPERIIVNELHGGEVWDFFQAINTGHDGSMGNLHATSVRDALSRLEIMATQADPSLPLLAIRENMSKAIDLIIQQTRLSDGSRRIEKISEVTGMQGDTVMTQDLFEFAQTGIEDGKITGVFRATGRIPTFMNRIAARGVVLPTQMFMSGLR
jgi:pilus assembly protein CpaF